MTGRHIPGQKRGKPILAKRLQASGRLLSELGRMAGGRGVMWSPIGPKFAQPGILIRIGQTGSDGIAARSGNTLTGSDVADVTLTRDTRDPFTAHLEVWSGSQYPGFNLSSQAVAGNTIIISAYMFGLWMTIWEDCPS
jgi:hypothetical protein